MYLIYVDLTLMSFLKIVDTITLQCHPIIFDPHYLSYHHVPTGMRTIDTFVDLVYDFLGLISVYTSQQYLIFTL